LVFGLEPGEPAKATGVKTKRLNANAIKSVRGDKKFFMILGH